MIITKGKQREPKQYCSANNRTIERIHQHITLRSVLVVCTVTPFKNMKKKNENHFIKDVKNRKCCKRLINKELLQVSGLCGTPFLTNLPKRWTQIYRAQYGNAILVSHRGAPILGGQMSKKTSGLQFCCESVCFSLVSNCTFT